ncbi:MAG: putative cytokinetic ring protein SteA [Acidimicrobiia bacterium]|nr:putative cytokinetic ring protein SteA [Acidimicrobiia bacterium]
MIVVRGHDYREDLRALRQYITEYHPVLVAVDGGADALLDLRLEPDMIIGDFDSLSDRAWNCGAELVHHVHPDGRAPGRDALVDHDIPYHEFVVEGTSEDAAMLLAYECRARLIVAVGTHASMVEFLDKGRAGMSSTFLTRLRIGPMLVDAKGVSQLYQGRVRRRDVLFLVAAALVVILAVVLASESLQLLLRTLWLDLRDLWYSLTGRFS